ncbi:DUF4153 domain-containing protein [Pedobacter zeae]|uniref:DUF4173 domain-containing protein n=1 Tax=Pedobacter zeae TaxID=1737356 RepID=A0A7W6P5Q7_9SPHI|nr:DUF4173 domain-containing protein [Pedobacter zeae]MBB4108292.1 hypothetical protein [Pedobacter zeae]GGG93757.1 hypothetical protein GCM10007422_03800 [Pedobacter zeae]
MKTTSSFLLLSTLLGGLLFSYIFWDKWLGLNQLIYSIFIITVTFLNSEVAKSNKFKIYASAHLLAAVLVVVNNSVLTSVSYNISLLFFVGFAHYQAVRTIYVAAMATTLQFITVPATLIKRLSELKIGKFDLKPVFKPIKYILLPLFIIFVFAAIYSGANQIFAHYLETTFTGIYNFFNNIFGFIFQDLSLPRFMHFCFGLFLTAALTITFYNKGIEKLEAGCKEKLQRVRRDKKTRSLWFQVVHTFTGQIITKKMALKTEYIIGLISFISLNLLLLCVNLIDISTLWLGYKPEGNFSSDLHDGTNALIFSIILAMAVILYFFRGNLNFYYKSKTLKSLAIAWMVQNFILIISVFIRDGYYIEFYGLTHKRIGVLVFAILCIIGLSTVYLKVTKEKTLFYLFKVNGNIWFVLLLAFSLVNWDVFITRYNLSHSDRVAVDAGYLLSLSDKTLPLLDQNRAKLHYTPVKDLFGKQIVKPKETTFYSELLNERIGYFKERYQNVSWLSWNLQDWNTAKYFGVNQQ